MMSPAPRHPVIGPGFVHRARLRVHHQPPLPPPPPPPPPPPEKPPPPPDELDGGEKAAAVALENSLANEPMLPMLSRRPKFDDPARVPATYQVANPLLGWASCGKRTRSPAMSCSATPSATAYTR